VGLESSMLTSANFNGGVILATPSCPFLGSDLADVANAGSKGGGLLRLPPDWYPSTLIISPDLYRQAAKDGRVDRDIVEFRLPDAILQVLAENLNSPAALIIRSSADNEGMQNRGRYESVICDPISPAIRDAVIQIYKAALAKNDPPMRMALLVQPLINREITGHMSNEHRISRDAWRWTIERRIGKAFDEVQIRVGSARQSSEGPIWCSSMAQLERGLRDIAKRLSPSARRYHLEWVWDGRRLWIVQSDQVSPTMGPAPGDWWIPRVGRQITPGELRTWKPLPVHEPRESSFSDLSPWPKIANVQQFARANLQTPELYVLNDPEIITSIASGKDSSNLLADMNILASGDLVIRTDVSGVGEFVPFLPKTENITGPTTAIRFLANTINSLVSRGVDPASIAFIAHRYIRSRACAWSYSQPDDAVVRIDSTWGLNDSLSWCPHDSAIVNVVSSDVSRRIVAKTLFLDVDRDGRWRFRDTPTEWIWRSSVAEGQLRTLAEGSRRLAELRRKPTVTMWLVNLLDYGDTDSLPWFCSSYQLTGTPGYGRSAPRANPANKRYSISGLADLEELASSEVERGTVLCLRPEGELVRDTGFVERVGDVALAKGLVVEIEGSPLAHPYYMLRRRDVPVNCVTSRRPKEAFSLHEKLVRDNIPEAIRSRGESVVAYSTASAQRDALLRAKLVEEALEVLRAADSDEVIEELADLLEVVDGLQRALGIREADIQEARDRKREERGGFEEGVVLIKTSPFGIESEDFEGMEGGWQQSQLPEMESAKRRVRRWQLREDDKGVLLSYVPPVGDEIREFDSRLGKIAIRIRYRDNGIEIVSLGGSDSSTIQDELPGF
jgi:predicted house-cleaning noncanonical NTP pyrophosphatase (MazG superfamily)